VFKHLKKLALMHPHLPVWVVEADGSVAVWSLEALVRFDDSAIARRTVLLPPELGGHDAGMLDGGVGPKADGRYDVADCWLDESGNPRRARVWDDAEPPAGMRLIRSIDTCEDSESDDDSKSRRRYLHYYVRPRSADDDGSRTASVPQKLDPHMGFAEGHARTLAGALGLAGCEADAVILASGSHDRGKNRAVWQRSIGNRSFPGEVLAKSGGRMRPRELNGYRHELGSLIDLSVAPEFASVAPEVQDLTLHLIAAHHGRARPHFPADEAVDPERLEADSTVVTEEVPRRFARLQRRYGRWGLAYLESLVRASDARASQEYETERVGAP